ncbi:DNA mismatch repair protein MutT [Hyphomicrobium nitrativorans NL23]|uniref:DNA mismatch repair protein MutT n=1 Tax=Hyphomicrobium nitrativorans NL23 TaxID=1029756 RepID=V5SH73_9HYPH|nr:DNA mismatch repair protein MutT [Hyphomicrobium nitrativorans NL23]
MRHTLAAPRADMRVAPTGRSLSDHRGPSDFDLNPELSRDFARAADAAQAARTPIKPAAVLVPVIARPELTLLFTLRTNDLPAHAGQIAFPGGKAEPFDADPLATALREAQEEIGLDPSHVEPLGTLDLYLTGTGYRITPVVALVDPGAPLTLDPREVADAFEVPLGFLMDPANHQRHSRIIGGQERHFHAMPFEGRFIWGATAGILRNMHERLFSS